MARNENKLKALVNDLPKSVGQHHGYLLVDFSDYGSFEKAITDYFLDNTVDILINNTQGPPAGSALEVSIGDYQKAFDLLFKSVALTTELALPHMIGQKWGRIINVASVSVKEPLSYLALSNSIRCGGGHLGQDTCH